MKVVLLKLVQLFLGDLFLTKKRSLYGRKRENFYLENFFFTDFCYIFLFFILARYKKNSWDFFSRVLKEIYEILYFRMRDEIFINLFFFLKIQATHIEIENPFHFQQKDTRHKFKKFPYFFFFPFQIEN